MGNHWRWEKKHALNNTNAGLSFDRTGSVPLNMYGKNINHEMFDTPPKDTKLYEENIPSLERIIKKLRSHNIKFIFVAQPYRQHMIDTFDGIRTVRKEFIQKTKEITLKNDGLFIDLQDKLHLGDEYFADREHLNSNGSILTAKEVAKFIDTYE
jgi:poly-D-alanine transfer protein DltD